MKIPYYLQKSILLGCAILLNKIKAQDPTTPPEDCTIPINIQDFMQTAILLVWKYPYACPGVSVQGYSQAVLACNATLFGNTITHMDLPAMNNSVNVQLSICENQAHQIFLYSTDLSLNFLSALNSTVLCLMKQAYIEEQCQTVAGHLLTNKIVLYIALSLFGIVGLYKLCTCISALCKDLVKAYPQLTEGTPLLNSITLPPFPPM